MSAGDEWRHCAAPGPSDAGVDIAGGSPVPATAVESKYCEGGPLRSAGPAGWARVVLLVSSPARQGPSLGTEAAISSRGSESARQLDPTTQP